MPNQVELDPDQPATASIAIVGLACIYPDCRNPGEFWENVLAQRRAFRRMPPERLNAADYLSDDPQSPDKTYAAHAAVIEGYEFDRVAFRVMGSTFRSADLAHWLALDVASRALTDAGFPEGEGLPRENTGVILGNTLTGEFSRANVMRLRWPYVRRVLTDALAQEGWSAEQCRSFLDNLEPQYKAPFPPVGEETLAGGLSNTIAGRICNYFNFKGGGYTVDGACASSLLAVAQACTALAHGDLDVAVAGGVDLSLDPFELVGFAKTNALARHEMLVYDRHASGFWPGEGCGFAVLMRESDALQQGRRIYTRIAGWGISSDGSGGITRPEAEGQLHAVRRTYSRAGFSIDSVGYFEGHGTGTAVGDATELEVLSRARQEADPGADAHPAGIGSIKANFGHTKAAAGIAGLIKATLALYHQVLPPTTGCRDPHSEFTRLNAQLRVLPHAEPWPRELPLRAGVSAMGFGGINTHLALENPAVERREHLTLRDRLLATTHQDCELFLLSATDELSLLDQVNQLLGVVPKLAYAELTDLSAELNRTLEHQPLRAAMVAASPREFTAQLQRLADWLNDGRRQGWDTGLGLWFDTAKTEPKIGFLFPGQASPVRRDCGLWGRRFDFVRRLYDETSVPEGKGKESTELAQPSIVLASLAGLQMFQWLGIEACCGVGHSLGELTALHWAGAFDAPTVLELAIARGKAMAQASHSKGAMAAVEAGSRVTSACLKGTKVQIVGFNSSRQTVVAGPEADIDEIIRNARARGLRITRLPVAHAFHTSEVAPAAAVLKRHLSEVRLSPLQADVYSTITGSLLSPRHDVRELLASQITSPVQFTQAIANACRLESDAPGVDLWIEVGPGTILSNLVQTDYSIPVVSLDAPGDSLKGLLQCAGTAFVLGVSFDVDPLFRGRFHRPFQIGRPPKFFINPCELAPSTENEGKARPEESTLSPLETDQDEFEPTTYASAVDPAQRHEEPLTVVQELIAQRTELPVSMIHQESRMLSDLHLNSITVSHLVAESARRLGLHPPISLTQFANATIGEIAAALEDLRQLGPASHPKEDPFPPGIDSWVRTYTVKWNPNPLPARNGRTAASDRQNRWQIFAPDHHPLVSALPPILKRVNKTKGVMVCLPDSMEEQQVALLLTAAQTALSDSDHPVFVLVQNGTPAAGFARTLHLESPRTPTIVVSVPYDHPDAAQWIAAEIESAEGFHEAHYDSQGQRFEPALVLCPQTAADPAMPIGPEDVLCVTGGGKGIAAECALQLGLETGVRLALIGRSNPETDAELAANLERIRAAGVAFGYFRADVASFSEVQSVIQRIQEELGPVTALLHGAGTNAPKLLSSLAETDFQATLAPKVQGLNHLLAALDPDQLRLLITFSSIIARTGLPGEADYAAANEWLSSLTEQFQSTHPHCRCLAVEWSVWSGTGMGERLGRIDTLMQQGISPITADQGVDMLCQLVRQAPPSPRIIVTGRFGSPPTVSLDRPELPFLRFLEQPRVHYPGVELIVEAQLSTDTDPYLEDHIFQGNRLFPAVMGLEAMAQTAAALVNSSDLPVFEEVQFNRPIVVPQSGSTQLRIAALVRGPDRVELAVRSEESGFSMDHFAAVCRFSSASRPPKEPPPIPSEQTPLPLDPHADLYGPILVHRGRFAKLTDYYDLRAQACLAEISCTDTGPWFNRYLPQEFLLGNPGERDAALHAIQACIPHARILPVGMDRLHIHSLAPTPAKFVQAVERIRKPDHFVYDVWIYDCDWNLLESWEGLHLKPVESIPWKTPWPEPLLGPYLERRFQELTQQSQTNLLIERSTLPDRKASTNAVLRRLLGDHTPVQRRLDGRPETRPLPHSFGQSIPGLPHAAGLTVPAPSVSASHLGSLVLATAGTGALGCDLVQITERPPSVWMDLLQSHGFELAGHVAEEAGEPFAVAAARVWSAAEALVKAAKPVDRPLVLDQTTADGWVLFHSGTHVIATAEVLIRGEPLPVMISILEEKQHAAL